MPVTDYIVKALVSAVIVLVAAAIMTALIGWVIPQALAEVWR